MWRNLNSLYNLLKHTRIRTCTSGTTTNTYLHKSVNLNESHDSCVGVQARASFLETEIFNDSQKRICK